MAAAAFLVILTSLVTGVLGTTLLRSYLLQRSDSQLRNFAEVFERFYRTDDARTRARGGAGLGLAIAASLTAAHGGQITVDTEPGRGAAFRICLPLAVGEETVIPPRDGTGRRTEAS